MDKMIVMEMTKNEIIEEVNKMNLENFLEIKSSIKKYFKLIQALEELPSSNEEESNVELYVTKNNEVSEKHGNRLEVKNQDLTDTVVVAPSVNETGHDESVNQPSKTLTENNADRSIEDADKKYRFERRIKGGWLDEIGAYVPEAIVRLLGIENGDYVKAHEKGNGAFDYPKHYRYELAEKGEDQSPSGRVQIDFCLVEKDGGVLVVRKSLLDGNRPIRLNDVPHSFILKDNDVQEQRIKEGDIVDIAYMESNPMHPKVIWKHDMETEVSKESDTTVTKKKDKETKADISKEERNVLSGKTILVVGCEPRKTVFKQNIEMRGGEFSWASGLEGKTRLASMIKKADVVLLLIRFIKHQASKDAVEICKEYGIRFGSVESLGVKSVIDEAILKSTA